MPSHHSTKTGEARSPLTTETFAAELALKPQSLRKRYSQTGSYFGICPIKLPNGRLRWPADAVERLLSMGDA